MAPDAVQVGAEPDRRRRRPGRLRLAACGQVQDAVLDVLREAGMSDLRLASVSVQQEFDHERGRPGGPRGTSQVVGRLPDTADAGEVVSRALAAGGRGVHLQGLTPTLSDRAAALAAARERAYADALVRAQQYAGLSGDRLGALLSVAEGGAAETGWVMQSASRASYDVPETDVDVSVGLVATWELLSP